MQYLIGFLFFLICFTISFLYFRKYDLRARVNKSVVAGVFYSALCMAVLYVAMQLFGKKATLIEEIPLRAISSSDKGVVYVLEIPITASASNYVVHVARGNTFVEALIPDETVKLIKEKRTDAIVERTKHTYVGFAAYVGFAPTPTKDRLRVPEGSIKIPIEFSALQ